MSFSERRTHNANRLPCPIASCRRRFRNQSGLTNHIRVYHHPDNSDSGSDLDSDGQPEAAMPQRLPSPPTEAQNSLQILQVSDKLFNQETPDSTPPSTPLAVPQPSPGPSGSFSLDIDQTPFDNVRSSSPREISPEAPTPEGVEPISKVYHPVINGMYYISWDFSFY